MPPNKQAFAGAGDDFLGSRGACLTGSCRGRTALGRCTLDFFKPLGKTVSENSLRFQHDIGFFEHPRADDFFVCKMTGFTKPSRHLIPVPQGVALSDLGYWTGKTLASLAS